mgnify:CR=1
MAKKVPFMKKAAGKFMTIQITVPRWTGRKQSKKVTQLAEQGAGAESGVTTGGIKMLGQHDAALKTVIAAGAKLGTYCGEYALKTGIAGVHMFHVDQVPEAWVKLTELHQAQIAAVESFLPEYERYVSAAKAHLADLSTTTNGEAIQYPSAEEVREKFRVKVGTPRAIPISDLKIYTGIPLGEAAKWAEEAEEADAALLVQAREYILDATKELMVDIQTNISAGNFRVSAKKADKIKYLATQLKQLVVDWDNNPRLTALVEIMNERILPPIEGRLTKGDTKVQDQIRRAAKIVVTGIDDKRKDDARLKKAKSSPSAAVIGDVQLGGMLADLD